MADKNITLYFSTWQTYDACPQRFLWQKGWDGIDCGGGVGKKKPVPIKESKHHAVMGQVIQKVIEDMYNDELWKYPKGLHERLLDRVEQEFNKEMERNYIDWQMAQPRGEMLQICKDGVSGYLKTMKANKLLGSYNKAEELLLGWVDKYTAIGGRADLIIQREDVGVMILDGKNSKEKGKYTTPEQLKWYALCYYLSYGKMPDKLGFVYYRFPYDEATGSTGIDWVECTKQDIKELAQKAVEAKRGMVKQKFDANPVPKYCQWCEYESVCPARKLQKEFNSRNRKKKETSTSNIETNGGFVELDFGVK